MRNPFRKRWWVLVNRLRVPILPTAILYTRSPAPPPAAMLYGVFGPFESLNDARGFVPQLDSVINAAYALTQGESK